MNADQLKAVLDEIIVPESTPAAPRPMPMARLRNRLTLMMLPPLLLATTMSPATTTAPATLPAVATLVAYPTVTAKPPAMKVASTAMQANQVKIISKEIFFKVMSLSLNGNYVVSG